VQDKPVSYMRGVASKWTFGIIRQHQYTFQDYDGQLCALQRCRSFALPWKVHTTRSDVDYSAGIDIPGVSKTRLQPEDEKTRM
jgi:hypothetical protein